MDVTRNDLLEQMPQQFALPKAPAAFLGKGRMVKHRSRQNDAAKSTKSEVHMYLLAKTAL